MIGAPDHERIAATEEACLPTFAGINIVLISRTQSRLDEAASEIEAKYKVKTKTLAVDFGKADAGTWSTLKAEVRSATTGLEGDQPLLNCICSFQYSQARCSATASADDLQTTFSVFTSLSAWI